MTDKKVPEKEGDSHPVVEMAKELQNHDRVRELSTGVRGRIVSVPQSIIQDALAKLKEPTAPLWHNPETGRDEPNEFHPDFAAMQEDHRYKQLQLTFDTFAMFGLELEDDLPDDDTWLKKLRIMDRLGHLDLDKFDLEDEVDLEFLYKRYIAIGNEDYTLIAAFSGISPDEVSRAARSFRGDETRDSD